RGPDRCRFGAVPEGGPGKGRFQNCFSRWDRYHVSMSAGVIYTYLLQDDQMRSHLEKQDTLVFKGLAREWQEIERQVERLGFGEVYVVTQRGTRAGDTKVSLLHS